MSYGVLTHTHSHSVHTFGEQFLRGTAPSGKQIELFCVHSSGMQDGQPERNWNKDGQRCEGGLSLLPESQISEPGD